MKGVVKYILFTPFLYLYSITDTTKKLQDMTKVTKKLEEIKEYRNTRNVSTDNEFMIAIITNLLKNISVRSNPMHLLLNTYKEQKRKIDSNLEIAIGAYICSLVTCWETFLEIYLFLYLIMITRYTKTMRRSIRNNTFRTYDRRVLC